MARPGNQRSAASLAMTLPAAAVLFGVVLLPVGAFFVLSFLRVKGFSIEPVPTLVSYADALARYGGSILSTTMTAFAVALLTTAIGFVYASLCRFMDRAFGRALLVVAMASMFAGFLSKIYAWRTILGSNGVLNTALQGAGITSEPVSWLLYSQFSMVITWVNFLLPLAVLPIFGALRGIDGASVASARDLGAGPIRIGWEVVLPQVRSGVVAAFVLTYLFAAGDYVTPRLVGDPSSSMAGSFIQTQFGFRVNAPLGAALSFLILGSAVVSAAVFAGALNLQARRWR